MCSIIGSKSKERLQQLAELNEYRGTHSHSVAVFDENNDLAYIYRGFGKLVLSDHNFSDYPGHYFIAHQQAPTTEAKGVQAIHPAYEDESLLWHNGIIKADDIARLQRLYETDEKWDTKLLLRDYLDTGNLSQIDGTFACVLYSDYQLRIFRNEISPMFYNEQGDISSTKFEGSMSVPANKVLSFTPNEEVLLSQISEFTTKENPYFFA